jgi:hypothetical protein
MSTSDIRKEMFKCSSELAMYAGYEGGQRDHRTGGRRREQDEQFENTLRGKLGECFFLEFLGMGKHHKELIDYRKLDRGDWDSGYDMVINGIPVETKTTKHIGSLLLLECKKWNEDGTPKHSIPEEDGTVAIPEIIVLVSLWLSKNAKDTIHSKTVIDIDKVFSNSCVRGFITRDDLLEGMSLGQDEENPYFRRKGTWRRFRYDVNNWEWETPQLRDLDQLREYLSMKPISV